MGFKGGVQIDLFLGAMKESSSLSKNLSKKLLKLRE